MTRTISLNDVIADLNEMKTEDALDAIHAFAEEQECFAAHNEPTVGGESSQHDWGQMAIVIQNLKMKIEEMGA